MQLLIKRVVLLASVLLTGCMEPPASSEQSGQPESEPDRLRIVVINAPLAYFAERLGGELVGVDLLVAAGADPANWRPEVADVMAMQAADLILLNGAGYEPWIERVSLPEARVLISSDAVADQLIKSETITHRHGPEGDHSHTETAFTLWLDPVLAVEQARSVAAAISVLRPEAAEAVGERMGDLERELQQLHEAWLQVAAQLGSAPVLFSHPVYQYLERRYQLNGRSLHWEPDADPGESEWSSLAQLLESRPATLMVWEGEPLPETVRRLSALGITTVVVEPAADAGPGADFLKRQLANVARFKTALKPLQ